MKVLLVNGSPRPNSNTLAGLHEMEKIFARLEPVTEDELKNYAEVEVYENLDNTEIRFVKSLK